AALIPPSRRPTPPNPYLEASMHQHYTTITAAIPLHTPPSPHQILGARLTVACPARTPDDCRLLLDILGLDTATAGPWQRPQQPLNSPPMNQNREQLVAHQADVYVDVTPEQRGVLWDYVHREIGRAHV